VQLTLKNGKKVFGTLKDETPTHVVVDAGGDQRVPKSDIAARVNGPSAMPPMGSPAHAREIRDVVEYPRAAQGALKNWTHAGMEQRGPAVADGASLSFEVSADRRLRWA
jgi:hypothetical protein